MPFKKLSVREPIALAIVLALAVALAVGASHAFQPLSFAWLAWCALGFFAIIIVWRELFAVDRLSEANAEQCENGSRSITFGIGISVVFVFIVLLGVSGFLEPWPVWSGVAAFVVLAGLLELTVGYDG